MHADAGTGLGLGAVLRRFAPDVARSFNLLYPRGLTEGVAVYHESRVQPGAGRLNFSLFQMQYRAAMASDRPWSLAQLLEAPVYDVPGNRFYIGGANLFAALAERDGGAFFRRMLDLHYRIPILGAGVELWGATATPPWVLGRRLRSEARRAEAERQAARGPLTEPTVLAAAPGRSHRRPRWIDDTTLVVHASGLDLRPGFYQYDARTGRRSRVAVQTITEDFFFSLDSGASALLYSRYVPDVLDPGRAVAEVFQLDLATGAVARLTHVGRAGAPVPAPDGGVWALRTDGPYTDWVHLPPGGGRVTTVLDPGRVFIVSLLPRPGTDAVALLAGVEGRQGIFRVEGGALRPWILFEDGAVLDAAWSRDGRYLLFTADPGNIADVYAYDAVADRVVRLTTAAYGALEPALSPDGSRLAYVDYQHERWNLVMIPFSVGGAEGVPASRWSARPPPARPVAPSAHPQALPAAPVRRYRAVRHLAPRLIYPTLRYAPESLSGPDDLDLGPGVGVAVQGADPLERWAYAAESYYQEGRLWGRFRVETGRLAVRPSLEAFDRPRTTLARVRDAEGRVDTLRIGVEERGATLGLRLPLLLRADGYTTRAALALRADADQTRLFDQEGETLRGFEGRVRIRPSATVLYRLQANPRDLVPNTGVVLSGTASVDAWRAQGTPRRAALGVVQLYLPVAPHRHTGVWLSAGVLAQNQGGIFDLDRFVPRGYEDEFFGSGTVSTVAIDAVQPVRYVEDGLVIVPVYVKVLYAYGFAETLVPVSGQARQRTFSSVGAGLGVQLRLFYLYDLDLRFGASYRVEEGRWVKVFR